MQLLEPCPTAALARAMLESLSDITVMDVHIAGQPMAVVLFGNGRSVEITADDDGTFEAIFFPPIAPSLPLVAGASLATCYGSALAAAVALVDVQPGICAESERTERQAAIGVAARFCRARPEARQHRLALCA